MKRKVVNFWFSPVYHTRELARKLGQEIASHLEDAVLHDCDLTDYDSSPGVISCGTSDIAIIAAPVYAGRIPPVFANRLEKIRVEGTPAILLTAYGNRAYENALAELRGLALKSGFLPVGACACVARHTIALIYGEGRPDKEDLHELAEFGKKCAVMLQGKRSFKTVAVPGQTPETPAPVFPLPQAVNENCVQCGICQQKCPVRAIDLADPAKVNLQKCICCMRCVALCPEAARVPKPEFISGITEKLRQVCSVRHANDFFDIQTDAE